MTASLPTPNALMIRKLESIFPLSGEEKQALQDLPVQVTAIKASQDIVSIGDRPSRCCLILGGFTCSYKLTSEGKRQILALHVPGDIPDLQSLHLKVLDNSIAAIGPCMVGFIQHEALRRICERYPRITVGFWRETLVAGSIFREWLLRNGQRDSYSRIAHLFCELMTRLKAVGLAKDSVFDLPISQADLANAIGTSTVHMNRIIQALRADGLIQTNKKQVTIPDWEKLKSAGDFDPLYLHLNEDHVA